MNHDIQKYLAYISEIAHEDARNDRPPRKSELLNPHYMSFYTCSYNNIRRPHPPINKPDPIAFNNDITDRIRSNSLSDPNTDLSSPPGKPPQISIDFSLNKEDKYKL